jgi:transposase-like protein
MKIKQTQEFFATPTTTIQYLVAMKILETDKKCTKCKRTMLMMLKNGMYRCNKCSRSESIFKGTYFSNCKLPINELMLLSWLYLMKMPVSGLLDATTHSSTTICEWTKFIRQLCGESIHPETMRIGGPGIVVEIDETKLGKRKYQRGHRVEGVWVVAGVERTKEKKIFAVEVKDRSMETMRNVLNEYVRPGSIVYTDCWKSYVGPCKEFKLAHFTVNHSKCFKDPITGVHTNTIEGCNNGIKTVIKPRNRVKKGIRSYLLYYIWRRQNKGNIWNGFVAALKSIKYI